MSTSNTEENEPNDDEDVTMAMILTAYKLYKMKAISCNDSGEFILPTDGKAMWVDPLLKIYEAAQNQSITSVVSFSISTLCCNITLYNEQLRNRLRKKAKDPQKELIRKIQIIYYNIVFDVNFRNKIYATFEHKHLDKDIISINNNGARITQGIFIYPGNTCIECNGKLSCLYRNFQNDAKGSIAIAYHKHEPPKICNVYQKRCLACDIYYNYNRIDYSKKTKCKNKTNQTIFLDPAAFAYFSIGGKKNNLLHQSILKSVRNHQYCNKSTSIEIWLQHFNEEWTAEYDKLNDIIGTDSLSIKLGYLTLLRYFYFYSLLCRIRDIENYYTINVNDRDFKVALIISNEDKEMMLKEEQLLIKAKSNHNIKTKTSYRESHNYFRYCFNKYHQQLITCDLSELKQVPVRINDEGNIEIYPGWFVLYGDGGEKITRPRCAYPAILSKYDYMMETADNEAKVNEIGKDDDIDLAVNYNSALYSSKRYYECDNTPQCNDPDNNRKSYKCCKYHTAKLVKTHGVELNDIQQFITWYQLHSAVARINNTNVQQTLQAQYTIDEEVLKSITTKHKKKNIELQNKIARFKEKHSEQHVKFKKFIEQILYKINSWRQKPRPKRRCVQKGQANVSIQSYALAQQEIFETITDILGDDDVNLDIDYYTMETAVGDLLDLEFNNNNYLDKHKGCRKSKFISHATTARTKGLNVLLNTAGIMITLREEIVRETPTAVILDIANSCTNNPTSIQYANRIEAIGYDMMCRIYYHLKSLIDNNRLPAKHQAFWCELIPRSFIDIWHIFTHTDELCKEKDGVFHPKLKKFDEILYNINDTINRINDIIAEQFWSTMNATHQLKSMNKETFILFLLEKRSYYNQAKINDIKQKGWTFIPIDWCTSLRNVESGETKSLSSKEDLQKNRNTPLERVHIKPAKVKAVKDKILGAAADETTDENEANIGDKRNYSMLNDTDVMDDCTINKKRKFN